MHHCLQLRKEKFTRPKPWSGAVIIMTARLSGGYHRQFAKRK